MASIKNIGIITSGGDCGGLNAVVRGAAKMAIANGIGAYIIPNGYAGLYNLINMEKLVKLDESRVDSVNSAVAGSVTTSWMVFPTMSSVGEAPFFQMRLM